MASVEGSAWPAPDATRDDWTLDHPLAASPQRSTWAARGPDGLGVVKVLGADATDDARARFRREVDVLAARPSSGLPRLLADHTGDDPPWFVMERVSGAPLHTLLRRPAVAPATAIGIALQLASVLLDLHEHGITHRDLHPGNVLWDGATVRVVDLGAARTDGSDLTIAGPPGTPTHAPPEWPHGDPALHDAFALGVLFHELLVGAPHTERSAELDPGPSAGAPERALVRLLTAADPSVRLPVAAAARRLARMLPEPTLDTLATFGDDAAEPADPVQRLGRLELRDVLGAGGMGQVWRAHDPELQREVAVKLLHGGALASHRARARFLREAQVLARLDHPALVRVLDAALGAQQPYIVLELVRGQPLTAHLRGGGLPWRTAATWAVELAAGLAHAHDLGVVHRDIKPSNVLVDESDGGRTARLTDFGVALLLDTDRSRLTRTDGVLGTPAYMAPEQARGERVGPPADVYALGALLYEMVSGRPAFEGDHPMQVLHLVLTSSPAPLSVPDGELPSGLRRLVARAMAPHAVDRPTAEAFARDLSALLDGKDTIDAGPIRPRLVQSWRRHRLAWTAAAAVVTVGLLAAGALATRAITEASREAVAAERLATLRAELPAMDERAADAALDGFLRDDANAGTRAQAAAWLTRAQRATADARRVAAARAYALAPDDPDVAPRALRLVADTLEWTDLDGRIWVGAQLAPFAPHDPLVVDGAFAARDPDAAVAADPESPFTRRVADLIRHTTPLPWRGAKHVVGDDRMIFIEGDEVRLAALAPPREVGHWVLPGTGPVTGLGQHDGAVLVVRQTATPGTFALHALRADAPPEPLVEFPATRVGWGTIARVAPDRPPSVFVGGVLPPRDLHELRETAEGWVAERPVPSITAAASGVYDIAAADIDDDGTDELLVVVSEWNAYDVRLLDWVDGALRPIARAKHGSGEHAVPWPGPEADWVVSRSRRYPSAAHFPDGDHHGPPAGAVLYGGGPALEVASPTAPLEQLGRLFTLGRADGCDLVQGRHGQTIIARLVDGGWRRHRIADVQVHGTFDPDGDGIGFALGVDTSTDRTVLLGVGDGPLPRRSGRDTPARPPGLPDREWREVAALVAVGASAAAESILAARAAVEPDDGTAAALLDLAGDLARADLRPLDALDVWAQPRALGLRDIQRRRVDLLVAIGRPMDALEVARDVGLPDPSGVVAAPELALGDDLDGWRVVQPGAVRPADDGWHIEGSGPMLVREVTWRGGPIHLEFEGTTRHLDDPGHVVFGLARDGTPIAHARVARLGPGQSQFWVRCGTGPTFPQKIPPDVIGPDDQRRARVRLDAVPGSSPWCEVDDGAGRFHERFEDVAYHRLPDLEPDEPLTLTLGVEGDTWASMDVAIARVRGLWPIDPDPTPLDAVLTALATGHPDVALAGLDPIADPVRREALRAVALDDLGRAGAARDALRAALAAGPLPPLWLTDWLRSRGGRADAALRVSANVDWHQAVWDAFGGALRHGDVDPQFATPLLHRLDLDALAADGREHALRLALARGRALRAADQIAGTEDHFRLVRDSPAATRALRSSAARELARLAVVEGRVEAAVAHARDVIALSAAPLVEADALRVDPALAPLADTPAWVALVGRSPRAQ